MNVNLRAHLTEKNSYKQLNHIANPLVIVKKRAI